MSPSDVPPPNRIPWPPLIYGLAAVAAIGAGWLFPGPGALDHALPRTAGWIVLLSGLALDIAAMIVMARRRANILPHRSATALVSTGPFAFSRNPIYLGNTIVLTGAGLAFANPWFFPAAYVAALAVTRLAIEREEAHLARLFGGDWDSYRRRTNRWFGRGGDGV